MRLSGTKTGSVNQYRGLGDQLWDLGGARPTLDLNFAQSKSLVDATTGSNLIDFTRASSGTYVGSDGLIKTAVTNLLLRSDEFSGAQWSNNSLVTANQAISPNGTLTADLLEAGASAPYQTFSNLIATYSASVYVKNVDSNQVSLGIIGGGAGFNATVVFNFSTATESSTGTVDSVYSASLGNGWYRIGVTATATGTALPQVRVTQGTGDCYLWGAQLEQSSTVGEYVPTTSTINSAPRFDHDPTTGESLGLLVEESRTNLALRSSELTATSIWVRTGVSFDANAATAPDGSTDADKMIAGTAPSEQRIRDDIGSLSSNASYTLSIFAKAAGYNYLVINHGDYLVADYNTWFDLATGTVKTNPAGSTAKIEDYGNGWYRCSVTRTTTATQNTISARFLVSNADNVTSFTGDGTSGIYFWGAQLEAGSFPTSYIPTEGSTVTRAADVASISGSNFSSWYRQDEGTVFAEATNFATNTAARCLFEIDDSTNANRITYRARDIAQNTATFFIDADSVRQFTQANIASLGTSKYKTAVTFSVPDGYSIAVDTQASISGSLSDMPSVNQLVIGAEGNAALYNGTIRRLTYWPQRLPDSTLQTITQ